MAIRSRYAIFLLLAVACFVAVGVLVTAQFGQQDTRDTSMRPAGGAAAPPWGEISADTFRNVAEAQMPMVVSIRTMTEAQPSGRGTPLGNDMLREFFGLPQMPPADRLREGAGSGFVIDADGLILTNHHVVENASRIEVILFPNPESAPEEVQRLEARVLGRDPLTDSALLEVTTDVTLPVATIGDSGAMRPGDWVMAIGNPFALSHTVTVGVISATSRPFPVEGRLQRVLQTDAAINPGNSGGPLLNIRGEVVGINTAIFSPGMSGGNVGIGFAVPINLVRDLIPQLRKGDVERGRIGVSIRSVPSDARDELGLDADTPGVLIASVEPGGPAARAGIQPGDVITTYNGETLDNADELVTLVAGSTPGTSVSLGVVRNGERRQMTITPEALQFAPDAPNGQSPTAADAFGLMLAPVTPGTARQFGLRANQTGAVVSSVRQGSPAAEAGVSAGDVIVEVNRERVGGVDDVVRRLGNVEAGSSAFLLVQRGDTQVFLVMTRGE
jgi:serine protease Do